MSNVDAPDVSSGETNNPDLLAEQSGIPNMSSTKTFTVDTNMQVNGDLDVTGTVTATSFIGDGSQLTGISGGAGGGLDSAGVTLLVDSDYVQARETPQDFAYSSLTGAPTALSSFTNDTNYITAADIPATVDSDYVAARAPAASGGLDSAGVQLLIDDDLIGSGLNSVAIGNGATSVGAFNVSVGLGASAPGQESISIGRNTIGFGNNSVAIGPAAKSYNGSVTIGHDAHAGENGIDTVVIGNGAGGDNTGIRSVAIGFQSGGHTHGAYSPKVETTHIGGYAGRNDPQAYSTGIGSLAGGTTQGIEAVAIGRYAGNDTQGANAVAIGSWAAQTSQPANSIAISAIGNTPTGTASPDGQYGIRIQTSDSGSLTYDTTNDWTFGATVTAPEFKFSDGTSMTTAPTGGGAGLDSAATLDLLSYGIQNVGSNQKQVAISLNTFVDPFDQTGTADRSFNLNYTSTTGMFVRETGGRTEIHADASGTGQSTGLLLTGASLGNNGTEIAGNLKLSSLPTSDPSETGLLWNDGGIPVFSGSTAPSGGGGLDSAGVTALINEPYLRDTLYDVATAQTNIGLDAGFASTSNFSIAIGKESGINSGNATNSIALGFKAGQSISDNSIMIGRETGEVGAGSYSVGIGTEALGISAGAGSVAIGYFASKNSAGSNSVAVGRQASATGDNAIAIGNTVTATTADAVTIGSSVAGRMTYDTTNDWTFGSGVTMTDLVASGATVVFSNLPTVDPVNAGQLWNDDGTMKISAG